ncbi:MAG: DEAD/DEAH box helicase [Candidatus Kariarchaeaceae archaeon]
MSQKRDPLQDDCPQCKKKALDLIKRGNNYLVQCTHCGFKYEARDPADRLDKAKFLQSYLQQKEKGFAPRKRKKRIIRKRLRKEVKIDLERFETLGQDEVTKIYLEKQEVQTNLPLTIKRLINTSSSYFVYYSYLPAELPPIGPSVFEMSFPQELIDALLDRGIENLYGYQYQAMQLLKESKNLIITAPTGMGKTEAFALPIIDRIVRAREQDGKKKGLQALLIYPTKALAADQYLKLNSFCKGLDIGVETYDGDTPSEKRRKILSTPPEILLTNPDMIHYHLRKNPKFRNLLTSLKFLVIDEVHLAKGSFGTNLHYIIWRLKRFVAKIQFIALSATISNAKNFAEKLFGEEVSLIEVNDARKAPMHIMMLLPKEESAFQTIYQTVDVLSRHKKKTIVFGNSHRFVEILYRIMKRGGINCGIHRAGLSAYHRQKVENDLREGILDVVVSTPTLELGIDIGAIDGVVSLLVGITSFTQRIGRAGRRGREGIGILTLKNNDPISSFYIFNPEKYFDDFEPAFLEPENHLVKFYQILSAIIDKPLNEEEAAPHQQIIDQLIKVGYIEKKGALLEATHSADNRLKEYSIRGMAETVDILLNGKTIGSRALPMAMRELHQGAIYLNAGNIYKVDSYRENIQNGAIKVATILRAEELSDYRTECDRTTYPDIVNILSEKMIGKIKLLYCRLQITENVTGYRLINNLTEKTEQQETLEEPLTYTFQTLGFVFIAPTPEPSVFSLTEENLPQEYLAGSFHAAEHIIIESAGMITGSGEGEIGGISMANGIIFVYDGARGGSGVSNLLYSRFEQGVERAVTILKNCDCKREDGCPKCTYSYQCGNNNSPLHKAGAISVLSKIIEKKAEKTDISIWDYEGQEPLV